MDMSWKIAIDAGSISVALLVATFLRAKLRFFQRFLIPNALTAGFLLLPVYNFLLPALGYKVHRLGDLVYHLLNLSFIAMTLRASERTRTKDFAGIVGISVGILSQYAIQALFGLLVVFFFLRGFYPDLSPAFGLFFPLGFALGPGQAYAIGKTWEGMGFAGAGSIGLAFAAIGYLWSSFVGVPLVNLGVRKGWIGGDGKHARDRTFASGIVEKGRKGECAGRQTTDSEAIDSFSYHAALIGGTYLLSFLALVGITALLRLAGKAGAELAENLWGINFIFSSITALLVKAAMRKLGVAHTADDGTLTRLAGFSVDFMVAGSVAAISISFVVSYWVPLLVITSLGGVLVTVTTIWMCSRLFRGERFERMIMIYGCSTGTLSTGLALLRVLDPEFRGSVTPDYMKSAGLTFAAAIPFVLSINLPAKAGQTGDMGLFWIMVLVAAAYFIATAIAYVVLAGKRAFAMPGKIWYPGTDEETGGDT